MHCGASHAEGGRAGDAASHGITESLRAIGFETGRMKTGTPARLDARTIDFEILEPQYGDENPAKFSFSPETKPIKEQLPCFLVYTSKEVHDILRIRQVAAVQRHDLRHRSALLPVDRGQTPHLCRQRPAPALPGTRRQFDQ